MTALRELEIARKPARRGLDISLRLPVERRQGRWEECIRDLERGYELDPRNVLTLQQWHLPTQLGATLREIDVRAHIGFRTERSGYESMHASCFFQLTRDRCMIVIDHSRTKNPAALSR